MEENVLVLPKYYNLEYLGEISLICATNSKMIQEKKTLQSLHILYTHTCTQTHTHSLIHTGIHGGEREECGNMLTISEWGWGDIHGFFVLLFKDPRDIIKCNMFTLSGSWFKRGKKISNVFPKVINISISKYVLFYIKTFSASENPFYFKD